MALFGIGVGSSMTLYPIGGGRVTSGERGEGEKGEKGRERRRWGRG